MQFSSVKFMLRWYFREFKDRETPKGLRSAASSGEVIGRVPSRLQDVEDVIQTYNKVVKVMCALSAREIGVLGQYYKSKKTIARIERDALNGKIRFKYSLEQIESKLEEPCINLKLISLPEYEEPRYLNIEHQVMWVAGANGISRHIGRSISWFYQFGLKDNQFMSILSKVGSRWEAKVDDLNKWRQIREEL